MTGLRAFGHNEGGLGHAGDFEMLFAPLLDDLSNMAVYGLHPADGFTFPFYWQANDRDVAEKRMESLYATLEALDICPRPRSEAGLQWPRYYSAGFFPEFTAYIRDDWNDLVCFRAPFPPYEKLLRAQCGADPLDYDARKARTPQVQRGAWLDASFDFYFRNIDACWWEVFSPHDGSMRRLSEHLSKGRISFQGLLFERDFPESVTPINREFKDVHYIWSPKEDEPSAARNGGLGDAIGDLRRPGGPAIGELIVTGSI